MLPSRRAFLKTTAGVAALACLRMSCPPHVWAQAVAGRKLLTGMGSQIGIVDLAAETITQIPIGFEPHGFVRSANNPDRVWVIKRRAYVVSPNVPAVQGGISAVEFDLGKQQVLQTLTLPQNAEFYGHGFLTPDESVLFISRVDMDSDTGYLTGYDTQNCQKIVADYPIAKGVVHESRLLPDGTAMVVSAGIEPGSQEHPFGGARLDKGALVQFDIAAGKQIRQWQIDDDDQMANHCFVLKNQTVLTLSHPRDDATSPGKVYMGKWEQDVLTPVPCSAAVTEGTTGECLSIAVNKDESKAVVTDPIRKRILILDTKTAVLEKEIPHMARGVVFDETHNRFIVSGDGLTLLDAQGALLTDTAATALENLKLPGTGAHCLLV